MSEKFSIVTHFFGENPDYIMRLYNSIKNQGVDWEWIVTDDFSDNPETDKTLLDISNLDPRVKRYVQRFKREMYHNPSIYATGDFIFHIDGDDLVSEKYLENVLYWFRKFPDVVLILSGCRWRDKSGNLRRYLLHHPFSENKVPIYSYLGRVWRAKHKIDWTGIFSKPEEMIRKNDHYIVNFLSTRGDILCLPRCFVEYEIGGVSNSTKFRTPEEVEIISRFDEEFSTWFNKSKTYFPWNTYFCTSVDPDFEVDCYPFLSIDWGESGKVGVFGFPDRAFKRKLLMELFSDLEIVFEPENTEDCDFIVIDGRNCKISLPKNKKIYLLITGEDDWYQQQLNGLSYTWFLFNERRWVKVI
jgi:hypothetical protein